MNITKQEWSDIINTEWGLNLSDYEITTSNGVMLTRTNALKPWHAIKANAMAKQSIPGLIGDISTITFIDTSTAELVVDYIKYGKHQYRVFHIIKIGVELNVILKQNNGYADFIVSKMEDLKSDPNFYANLNSWLGTNSYEIMNDYDVALLMTYRTFNVRKIAVDAVLDNATLVFNVTNQNDVINVDMVLYNGDTQIETNGNLIYFTPRGNHFSHRYKGGSELGSSLSISTDFRNREPGVQHLYAESIDDLKNLYLFGKAQAMGDSGEVKYFTTAMVIDIDNIASFYKYAELNK